MPSTATSILDGLSTSVAVKAPCRTVATSNITLAGLQTISGYTTVEDDRVLVKGQTNPVDNGIYMASTGNWIRAKDADGNRDLVQGSWVRVRSTTINGADYELTSANPIVIGTTALTFELRYGANATYDQTEAEIAAGVTPTNQEYPELHAFRYMTSAQISDVTSRTGLVDVRASIQAAVDVAQQIGGKIYCPAGSYLIRRVAGGDSQFNGIHVPYTNVFGYDDHVAILGDGRSTVFLAGDNNMIVLRWSDSNGRMQDFAIDANSKTNVTGIGLLGSNTADVSLAEHIDWNVIYKVDIRGCAEGFELENPSAGGCYFNSFKSCNLYLNTRHIRLRDNAVISGANRNEFIAVKMQGGTYGFYNDGADTNKLIGCSFDGITTGVFQTLLGTLGGLNSQDTQLIGCTWEACTTDINTAQRRISILGGNAGAAGAIVAANGIDLLIGGDHAHWYREVLVGGNSGNALLLQTGEIPAFSSTGPVMGTSSNQAGSYPFDADTHTFIRAKPAAGKHLVFITGTSSTPRLKITDTGEITVLSGSIATTEVKPTYGSTVNIDLAGANTFTVVVSNGSAFSMAQPTNQIVGKVFTVVIQNSSGGAMGVITWSASYKMSAWTNPANGQNRSITFECVASSFVRQISQTGVDVPN